MPDADGEYCRMRDSLPQSIAANALEYSEVPLSVHIPWVLLLMPRILRDNHAHYILEPRCCCQCATTLQKQNLSPYPPISHFSLKLHCISKFSTEISKTGPLHTFCIHLLWGLRVSASTDMVQPSPQLNRLSCVWRHNTLQLPQLTVKSCASPHVYVHTVFQLCIAISASPGELICSLTTWSSPVAGMELQVPGCGTHVAATPKSAIIFCALSFRSAVICVLNCVARKDELYNSAHNFHLIYVVMRADINKRRPN